MEEVLKSYYSCLQDIRTYLIKIGPKRRSDSETICDKKLEEANEILDCFKHELSEIKCKQLNNEEIALVNSYTDKVKSLFDRIADLCAESKVVIKLDEMETFNLKTAVSLLPIMNDKENVTKQLISAIELYESMLKEESKTSLVQFVLKTRLSESATLRLSQKYDTVKLLVDDMRKHLLTKTSFTALQQKLLGCTQNQKSIEDFGKEIEELFVGLTVSQADGDSSKYEILKPLNEKSAIRRFASGLRNSQLSTVITARNYESLKDAIRGAKDEQMSTTTSEGIMKFQRGKSFNNSYSYKGRGNRGSSRYINHNSYRGQNNSQRGHPTRGNNNRGTWQAARSNYESRGRYNNNNRGYRGQNSDNSRMYHMTSNGQQASAANTGASTSTNNTLAQEQNPSIQFFR